MVHKMKEISSPNNEYIKYLIKLKEKKYRNSEKKFIVEGYHLVNEAYQANILEEILIVNDIDEYKDISKIKVTEGIIKKLSTTVNPQNIIGICSLNINKNILGERILLLDNINDPGNLGTLIRSSLGFDISTIVISPDSVDVYNEKVIRASQGAIFKTNIIIAPLNDTISQLKEKNIKIIGTSLDASYTLKNFPKPTKYAILLGNEAQGVKENLLSLTDVNLKIEMNNKLESLNVAVAGSIIMYFLKN